MVPQRASHRVTALILAFVARKPSLPTVQWWGFRSRESEIERMRTARGVLKVSNDVCLLALDFEVFHPLIQSRYRPPNTALSGHQLREKSHKWNNLARTKPNDEQCRVYLRERETLPQRRRTFHHWEISLKHELRETTPRAHNPPQRTPRGPRCCDQ